jgi:hypothetical protein
MAVVDYNTVSGIAFLGLSCVAFFTMLHLLGTPHTQHARLLRIVHRATGGIAVAIYIVFMVACIARACRAAQEMPFKVVIHFAFAVLFIPFVLTKIVIVEKYPELRNRLFAIGMVLFGLVFVIFFTSAMPCLGVSADKVRTVEALESEGYVPLGKDLFATKCSKCHRLDVPLSAGKSPSEWRETVSTMRQKDRAWISALEAERITEFLVFMGGQQGND